ncbi:hypothetical protein HK097_007850, partial [Rhizophlyctis rosea]
EAGGREVMKITGIEDVGVQTDSGRTPMPVVKPEEMEEAKGRIKELEKDLFYYRKTSKDLKNKLREVVGVNHRLAGVLREKGWDGVVERHKGEAEGNGVRGQEVSVGGHA